MILFSFLEDRCMVVATTLVTERLHMILFDFDI